MQPSRRFSLQNILAIPGRYLGVLAGAVLFAAWGCDGGLRNQSAEHGDHSKPLFVVQEFSTALKSMLPDRPADSTQDTSIHLALTRAYAMQGYRPIWLPEGKLDGGPDSLLVELLSLGSDGLETRSYPTAAIRDELVRIRNGKPKVTELVALDTLCTHAYLLAARHLYFGAYAPRRADTLWFIQDDSTWNAPALVTAKAQEGAYPTLASFRSTWPDYNALQHEWARQETLLADTSYEKIRSALTFRSLDSIFNAVLMAETGPMPKAEAVDTFPRELQVVAAFQWKFGLPTTGKMDTATFRKLLQPRDSILASIAVNLERLRWLPQHPPKSYVLVNIPMMEMFYREGSNVRMQMRAVVGKLSRQTPSLSAPMTNVVINPSWGVPPTILKNDVLPGVRKRGGSYLTRKGLKAYDRKGRLVNAAQINAKNVGSLSFRQPPGARNALGDVKFNLPNRWDIYLHDTPHREDFPRRYRALSSGCVRLQHPRDFATFILNDLEQKGIDRSKLDSMINRRQTKIEDLKNPIPVYLAYLTAFAPEPGGAVRFLPDVYKHDKKPTALIVKGGK